MRIGIIGDIHGAWDARDTAAFNASDYDALLFVGDFARVVDSRPVARRLAGLRVPAWAIPGNHDAVTGAQLWAEIQGRPLATRWGAVGMRGRIARLRTDLGPVTLGGYSVHRLAPGLGLIIARPHAMGGDRFYFRSYLQRAFGVADFAASRARLYRLIDNAPGELVILAHNGPAGLGASPGSPFGCDFAPAPGDFGDPDLRDAIEHARASGRRLHAVVAGHMHHRLRRGGGARQTWAQHRDTLIINAARVPRIEAGGTRRHHIRLVIDAGKARAETRWLDAAGHCVAREPLGPAPS